MGYPPLYESARGVMQHIAWLLWIWVFAPLGLSTLVAAVFLVVMSWREK